MDPFVILVFLIAVALLFDFLNGLHDAANSIATIVSTRVLPPRYAVAWAAFFNFIAFAVFGLHVANTIGKGLVDPHIVSDALILGALMGNAQALKADPTDRMAIPAMRSALRDYALQFDDPGAQPGEPEETR